MTEETVKQRLAAVLAADVAGYSRLMGEDERATIATLDEYRAVFRGNIEANAGRIIDMAGDSVLAVFDSATAAVKAAVDAQGDLAKRNEGLPEGRRMEFRVGVNSGDIQEKSGGTIYGDGVNVAARLEAMANPGGINVSGSVFDSVQSQLGLPFDFLGEQDVKNIADPVRAYRLRGRHDIDVNPKVRLRPIMLVSMAFIVGLILVAGMVWWMVDSDVAEPETTATNIATDDPTLTLPTGRSIAVMPIKNVSGNADQDPFANGLTLDLITAFSRFKEFFVFGHDTTVALAATDASVESIGSELGADYVLTGTVRRTADKIRISIQLTDTASAQQIWGETYDRSLSVTDMFAIQDDVVAQVAGTVGGANSVIVRATIESSRGKSPENLETYDCIAMELAYWDYFTPEKHAEARNCLEQAVKREPNYSPAWASLAWMYSEEFLSEYNVRPDAESRAIAAAEKAVALDPANPRARQALAHISYYTGDDERFFVEVERSVELNSNDADILGSAGLRLIQAGQFERGEKLFNKAKIINPHHPAWLYYGDLWLALKDENFEAALAAAQKAYVPDWFWTYATLAAVYGHLGRQKEAEDALKDLWRVFPSFDPQVAGKLLRFYVHHEPLVEIFLDGLGKAGLSDREPSG